jgi:hypothetical protein
MALLVEVLAKLEMRPVWQILNDLLAPPADVARLRTLSETAGSGSILLEDSIRLRLAARELLLASAHSTLQPRANFPRMSHPRAVQFISECKEGQTERGSYVASILIPVSPEIGSTPLLEDPFPRQVTRTFMGALLEAADVMRSGPPEALLQRAHKGLSANFLDALSRLRPAGERSHVEISITWSRCRTAPDLPRSQVRFEEGMFPLFAEAARTLREANPSPGVEIEGYIVSVKREERDRERPGTVVVATHLEGRPGTSMVKVDLPPQQYKRAVDAHKEAGQVKMVGTLSREGRTLWLREATLLEVVQSPELEDPQGR